MNNNERSFNEIVNTQANHSIQDCLEAFQHGVTPDHIKSKLLLDCLLDLNFNRSGEERSLIQYLIDSAIEDGFSEEQVGTDRCDEFLNWAMMHIRTETDDMGW